VYSVVKDLWLCCGPRPAALGTWTFTTEDTEAHGNRGKQLYLIRTAYALLLSVCSVYSVVKDLWRCCEPRPAALVPELPTGHPRSTPVAGRDSKQLVTAYWSLVTDHPRSTPVAGRDSKQLVTDH